MKETSKFVMSQEDWDKIIAYSQMSYDKWRTEIGGMCVALFDEDKGLMVISDPVVGKQTVSSTLCTLDKNWLADYYMEMAVKHGTKVRFVWWHSHHTMGVNWSGTDTDTMEEFNKGDYSMSLVVNLKQDHTFRVSWWKPLSGYIDTKLHIQRYGTEVTESMQASFDELVKREVFTPTKMDNSYRNPYISNTIYGQSSWTSDKYKQPNNKGPGLVDAELMDTPRTLEDKYADILDELLSWGFLDQMKWSEMKEEWDEVIVDAKQLNLTIKPITKNDYSVVLTGGGVNTYDYIEPIRTPDNLRKLGGSVQEDMFGI